MPLQYKHLDRITTEEQEKVIADIDRVMRAVFELGPDADPADLKKLYAMLAPADPTELEYVTLEEAA